jgi:hypothetical protein
MITSGIRTLVGRETLQIGGEAVESLHYRMEQTMSGDQRGTEKTDMWFSATSGLPLRNERLIEVVSPAPSPLDEVTYTERGNWELTSLQPQT